MTKRDIITGTLDSLFMDTPYTLGRDDETSSLRLQGQGLKAMEGIERRLREQHGSITPEVIVRESASIAKELAPYLQANTEATYRGSMYVADAVARSGDLVGGEVREGSDRIVQAIGTLGATTERTGHAILGSLDDIGSGIGSLRGETVHSREAITGMYDPHTMNQVENDPTLEFFSEDIIRLFRAGIVSRRVVDIATNKLLPDRFLAQLLLGSFQYKSKLVEWHEEFLNIRRNKRTKLYIEDAKDSVGNHRAIYHHDQKFDHETNKGLYRVRELTDVEIITLDNQLKILSEPTRPFDELVKSGDLSLECLVALNDLNLLPKALQTILYEKGIIKPKLGTLADLGISLRRSATQLGNVETNTARTNAYLARMCEQNGQASRAQVLTAGLMGMALREIHTGNQTLERIYEQGAEAQGMRSRIAEAVEGSVQMLGELYDQGEVAQLTREEILAETVEGNRRLGLLYDQGEIAQGTREAILEVTERSERARAISARRNELLLGEMIRTQAEALDVSIESRELLRDVLVGVTDITDELGRGIEVIGTEIAVTRIKIVTSIRELSERSGLFHQEAQEVRLRQLAVLEEIRDAVGTAEYMKTYAQRFRQAEELKADGLIDEAVESYEEAFRNFKGDHKLYYQIALIRERNGQHEEAAKTLEKAEKLAKDAKTKAYYRLVASFVWVKAGNLNKAQESANEAAKLDPENADIHFSQALICLRNGNKEEAAKALLKALSIDESMIFKVMGQNEFNPFDEDVVENVYGPFVNGSENMSLEVLYILTYAIEEAEDKIDAEVKTKLRVLWKRKLKEVFKKKPSDLVRSKYLEDFTGTTNRGLVLEVTKEVVEEGELKFENADDYFFLAGLYSAVEANKKIKLYELLADGLEADKRVSDEKKFDELTEHLKVIFGEQTNKLLRSIAVHGFDGKFENYKQFLKQLIKREA